MTSSLRTWFEGRSLRERRLILAMLALAALTLVWAAVVRPVRDGLASARERHADAVIRLAETETAVDAIRAAGRRVARLDLLRRRERFVEVPGGREPLDELGGQRHHHRRGPGGVRRRRAPTPTARPPRRPTATTAADP